MIDEPSEKEMTPAAAVMPAALNGFAGTVTEVSAWLVWAEDSLAVIEEPTPVLPT